MIAKIAIAVSLIFANTLATQAAPQLSNNQSMSTAPNRESDLRLGQHRESKANANPSVSGSAEAPMATDPKDYGKLPNLPQDIAYCTPAFIASCTAENCKKYSSKFSQCRRCEVPPAQLDKCLEAAKRHISNLATTVKSASVRKRTRALEVYDRLNLAKRLLKKQIELINLLDKPIKGTFHLTIPVPQDVKNIKSKIPLLNDLASDIEKKYKLQSKPNADTIIDNWDNMFFAQMVTILQTNTSVLSGVVKKQIAIMADKKRTTDSKTQLKGLADKTNTMDMKLKTNMQEQAAKGNVFEFQENIINGFITDYNSALKFYSSKPKFFK